MGALFNHHPIFACPMRNYTESQAKCDRNGYKSG